MVGVGTARQESWGRCCAYGQAAQQPQNPRTVGVTQTRGMSGAPAAAKARSVLRPERQRSSARGGYWLGGGEVRLRGPYSTLIWISCIIKGLSNNTAED
eukprot:366486-Chlamydomonas_euryale.AAC.6